MIYALVKILVSLLFMISLLRKRIHISYAVLAATAVLFVLSGFVPQYLGQALYQTIVSWTTWNMIFTLYLVMCLEYLLRTSGILKDFTQAAGNLFQDNRIVLGFMPAFLGFLPSLGGAIFSAPMVEEAAQSFQLSPERKTAINYWFRHIWEFCNPILPSMLLAASLTAIPVGKIIGHQFIISFAAILIGAVLLLRGKDFQVTQPQNNSTTSAEDKKAQIHAVIFAIGPILLNVFLVTVCNLNTTLSMFLIIILLMVLLHYSPTQCIAMLRDALNMPIINSILAILFFQGMLYATGTIDNLILFLQASGISASAVIYLTAFFMGLLTGLPQGFAAIAFPFIVPMLGPNLDVLSLTYISGLTGVMLSPAHLCLIVTTEYFHSSLFGSLKPVAIAQLLLLTVTFLWMTIF